MTDIPVLLVLDLAGTFAFAVNGALTAVRTTAVDIVGVVTLGMITGLGGGIVRDVLLGAVPPATFADARYLAVAAAGGLLAFVLGHVLARFARTIDVLDAAGLSLFAVTGAGKALALGAGPAQAVILGAVTAVGGGTLRDVLLRRVPSVLTSELYAIPALLGATVATVLATAGPDEVRGLPTAVGAAAACFVLRLLGLHLGLDAPRPPGSRHRAPDPGPGDGAPDPRPGDGGTGPGAPGG
ncbi:trimeric intracellular cation channel family protein [Cellulomonas endophytica]|uniref:trimeric intracellular cation channel family protein n=1 Tax=Cellulomonas endophytica TaxID=2494735 RepID=UPI001013198E|nr:trimeric intracellular cation channel family protein [Cellulomonas endophytica]